MDLKEWALIIFTIIGQMSVGAFWVLGVAHLVAARKYGVAKADRLSDLALLAIGPVLALGFLASLLHLGNPLNAPRTIMNLSTSPLSWEILLGASFAAAGGLFAVLQWRKLGSPALRNLLALLAGLIGIGFIAAMSWVYMLPAVPAWNSPATPISFFTTTLLLGVLAIAVALVVNYRLLQRRAGADDTVQLALLRGTLRWSALAAVVALGIHVVVIPLYLFTIAAEPAGASVALLSGNHGLLLALRLALIFSGAGLLSTFIYQTSGSGRVRLVSTLAYAAFALVLLGETIGRYLFYSSFAHLG